MYILFHPAKDMFGRKSPKRIKKGDGIMSTNNSNHLVNPAAREAMDKFKMEAAADFRSPIHLKKAPYIP